MKFSNILTNKYVLYLTLFLAISNIIGYLAVGDEESLIFFITIGVLSTFFSNNMIVVFLIAILSTNIVFAGNIVKEGLETMKKNKTKKGATATGGGATGTKKEKFTQKNIPSSQPAPASEEEEDEAMGKRIDYASTLEQAYDNLQQMLGPDGINGLSNETKNLVFQQKSLMKNLNDMAPVIKTAKETLDTMSGSMPNFNNLQKMMASFGGGFGMNKKKAKKG
jgi:hypothetical protein